MFFLIYWLGFKRRIDIFANKQIKMKVMKRNNIIKMIALVGLGVSLMGCRPPRDGSRSSNGRNQQDNRNEQQDDRYNNGQGGQQQGGRTYDSGNRWQ